MDYMESFVSPALVALATSIGKDVMWKPLNHQLLLLTRDKKKLVRLTAIKTLHQLFLEVLDGSL